MKKVFLLILISIVNLTNTHAERIILHCETAGCLKDTLEQKGLTNLASIHTLTVSGHLHAGDFRLFKQMELDSLDLSDIQIDAFYGIGTYESGMFGNNNARQYEEAEIPMNAFSFRSKYNNSLSGLESLVHIQLPTTLKSIGTEAFSMTSITSITFPSGLETIRTDAFLGCPKLTKIEIPASIIHIGETWNNEINYGAFACCESLKEIKVAEGNEYYTSMDGVLFNKDKTLLLQYPAGKDNTEYRVPDGITRIAHRSFEYNQSLGKITLPSSVEVIERAFWNCNKLRNVICESQIPPIWRAHGSTQWVEAFDYATWKDGTLTVPSGCKKIYSSYLDSWGLFQNILEAELITDNIKIKDPSILITTEGSLIRIRQEENKMLRIQIHDITGRLLQNISSNDYEQLFVVPKQGFYIININGKAHKHLCR